ncbi:hypothetical protein BX666DRAFT_2028572 [Dichotomocladium elegans]|nr:hypothetical protein BX666DRAFT_2028572 [Dichotomocladium elegans]
MDRYPRGYDERYRGHYDRPRSDTYRPGENYRHDRDYRDEGSSSVHGGPRNYSPSSARYGASRSPGRSSMNAPGAAAGAPSSGRSSSMGGIGSGSSDRYPDDHWYGGGGSGGGGGYNEPRSHGSSHYSPSRMPSPSHSPPGSPRRSSYSGYYSRRSNPALYSHRSNSPGRRDSYEHRSSYHHHHHHYHHHSGSAGSSNAALPPGSSSSTSSGGGGGYAPYAPSASGSGYPYYRPGGGAGGSRSRSPSAPFASSSYSPRRYYPPPYRYSRSSSRGPPPSRYHDREYPPTSPSRSLPHSGSSPSPVSPSHASHTQRTSIALASTAPVTASSVSSSAAVAPTSPSAAATASAATTAASASMPSSGATASPSPSDHPKAPPVPSSSSYQGYSRYSYHSSHYSGPPLSSATRYPHSASAPHRGYHHPTTPAFLAQPPRPRQSWAPDQEKEMERYHAENRKTCAEELKIVATMWKSRFQLEMASWETRKLDHQLELVQKQWDECGCEELVAAELASKSARALHFQK